MIKIKPLEKYGRLTVIRRVENHGQYTYWECICDCGNKTYVTGRSLTSGHTKSCGCLQREKASEIAARGSWFHNNNLPMIKNIRTIYFAIKNRCYNRNNPEYQYYGGKGVVMCQQWLDNPETFYHWAIANGFKPGLTIDRIDNDKGYLPQNCRFATRTEQNRNTSRCNKVIDEHGNTFTTAEVARKIGVSRATAAKWFREEHLRTISQFFARYENIPKYNKGRTQRARGL